MNIKKSLFISLALITVIILMSFVFGKDKDPLHKRIFNLTLFEAKEGGQPGKKGITDKIEFKDGRLFSDFLYEKFQYKWIKYRINKDSIFTDSTDTEVRLLEVEASTTDEKNQTIFVNFNTVEWDAEGTIKITKNDKIKKQFDFVGREKGGKPKKEKKPKKIVVNPDVEEPKEEH